MQVITLTSPGWDPFNFGRNLPFTLFEYVVCCKTSMGLNFRCHVKVMDFRGSGERLWEWWTTWSWAYKLQTDPVDGILIYLVQVYLKTANFREDIHNQTSTKSLRIIFYFASFANKIVRITTRALIYPNKWYLSI